MPSAIELSVRFGIDRRKIEQICSYLGVSLDESEFAPDKDFEKVARSVRRKRVSAGTLAWMYEYATGDQREFLFEIDPSLQEEFENLGNIPPSARLRNAEVRLDALASDDASMADWSALAVWMKNAITSAEKPVRHNYLAARALLGLPKAIMQDRARTVATVFNKARHRGHLAGWFETVEEDDGSNSIVYNVPGTVAPATLNLKPEGVAAVLKMYEGDLSKAAGFIANEKKLKYADVLKYLQDNAKPLDEFDL